MDLNNKLVIVTGCSKGIGFQLVKLLLNKGAKVAGWSRATPEIIHPSFKFYATDVTKQEAVEKSYQSTINDFGTHVSVLINNAGLGFTGNLDEITVKDWLTMFDTNVHGVFYCTRQVLGKMKEIGEGHVINIGSIAGKEGSPSFSGYCGTKFALRGISQALYKEVRDYGVKVSLISPGSIQTNFFDNIDAIQVNENMMRPEDIALAILSMLETSENFHPIELEV